MTWSVNFVIISAAVANQGATFAITDTKLYVPLVTLSTKDNVKLLDQLKSGFKRTINWSKYQSKATVQTQNHDLGYLIDPRFQGVNKLFVLSFEDNVHRTNYKRYVFPTVEIKDYNLMIDGVTFSINW